MSPWIFVLHVSFYWSSWLLNGWYDSCLHQENQQHIDEKKHTSSAGSECPRKLALIRLLSAIRLEIALNVPGRRMNNHLKE